MAYVARGSTQRFAIGVAVVLVLEHLSVVNQAPYLMMMVNQGGNQIPQALSQATITSISALAAGLISVILVRPSDP